jgi:hypothetical protein
MVCGFELLFEGFCILVCLGVLPLEKLLLLMQVAPTDDELLAFKALSGEFTKLSTAEAFLAGLAKVRLSCKNNGNTTTTNDDA